MEITKCLNFCILVAFCLFLVSCLACFVLDIALSIIKRSKIFIKKKQKKNIDRESEANSFETSTFKERLSVETLKLMQEK
jgi:hypothetical protein